MSAAHHTVRFGLATAVTSAGLCVMLAIGTAARSPQSPAPVIAGRVTTTDALPPNPLADLALPPASVERGDPEVRNVIVFLRHPPVKRIAARTVEMRQADEEFVPHVLAVAAGTTVSFPNGDPLFHNVFSLAPRATFDLGRYPKGDTRTRVFTDPGIVKVFCRIHSYMSAVIRVFDHPYHAVPDDAGRFSMPAPAPGTYDLVVWHERSTEEVHRVTVTASGARLTLAHPRTGS